MFGKNYSKQYSEVTSHVDHLFKLRKVSFLTGRGAPENWRGIRYFFLDQKGGIKRFVQIKKGNTYILKKIKYFVKHFRTQMDRDSC